MKSRHLLPLSLLALSACGGGADPGDPDPNNPDTPNTPAGCDVTKLTVTLTSPTADVHTRGAVTVQLAVSEQAEKVELLRDGTLLAVLTPPYTYAWDTAGASEGTYSLSGRATCGGKTVDSQPRAVSVDRTPPSVAARLPQPGAQQVAVRDTFRVEFSEPLLPSSVNDAVLTVRSGATALEKTLSLSSDGRTLTVVPQGLVAPASVELLFGPGLTDRAGNALVVPSTAWSVTLPGWLAVGEGVPEETGYAFPSLPSLQFDADGSPLVVFRASNARYNQTQYGLFTRRFSAGAWSEWKPSIKQPIAPPISFAAGAQGHSVLAYPLYPDVSFRYYAPGQQQPLLHGYSRTEDPMAALAPNGEAVVASIEQGSFSPEVPPRLRFSRLGATVTSYPSIQGSSSVSRLYSLGLAVDAQGLPWVLYQQSSQLYVQRYDGTAWRVAGTALETYAMTGKAVMRLDAQGRPVVVWRRSDAIGEPSSFYIHRLEGNTWVPLGSGFAAGPLPPEAPTPSLAFDAQGNVVLAYAELRSSQIRVEVRQWTGSAWSSLGALSQTGGEVLVGPEGLALDREGRLTAAVQVTTGSDPQVRVWRANR